jgi:hypothetical protein
MKGNLALLMTLSLQNVSEEEHRAEEAQDKCTLISQSICKQGDLSVYRLRS